jgi:hypothetical protein
VNRFSIVALAALAALGSGCGFFSSDSTSSDTTSPTKVGTQTEAFSGTLTGETPSVYVFSVTGAGAIAVTLTTLTPATASPVSLGIGTSSVGATSCTPTTSTPSAVAGSVPQLTINGVPGAYCLDIHNIGSVAASAFTITVDHS